MSSAASAASSTWIADNVGDYGTASNWNGGIIPGGVEGNTDTATINGATTAVTYASGIIHLGRIDMGPANFAGNRPVFNQSGGTINVGTLAMGAMIGASKSPTYNLSAGTLNIGTSITWGNGGTTLFNQTGGTVNHAGTTNMSFGLQNGALTTLRVTGGTFNANSAPAIFLGNEAGGKGLLDVGGTGVFNATSANVSLGQFGTSGSQGTLTLSGTTSQVNVKSLILGGANASSVTTGIVNLNGGTLSAESIQRGNSSITPSATQNVLHANGGTIRSLTDNASYFGQVGGGGGSIYVNIRAGGLTFDTNGKNVGISTVLHGDSTSTGGGLTKTGEGTLLLNAATTYSGITHVKEGELRLGAAGAIAGSLTVDVGASLSGEGSIAGAATIAGSHSVGASPGQQTFSGGLEYESTASLNWELVTNSTGDRGVSTGYDAINVTGGALTVSSGAIINLIFNGSGSNTDFADSFWGADQSWQIIDLDGGTSGSSDTFSIGSISADSLGNLYSSYGGFGMTQDGSGDHYLTWTAIPEPSAMLLSSLGALGILRRRRNA